MTECLHKYESISPPDHPRPLYVCTSCGEPKQPTSEDTKCQT